MKRFQDPDYGILVRDPRRLLLSYQELIRACVWDFVSKGMFDAGMIQDLIQNINEELLKRLPNLQAGYNGSFLVRTYVAATVRNICLRIREQENRTVPAGVLVEEDLPNRLETEKDRYSIEQMKRVFHAITLQYHRKRPKLIICLKLWCRLPLSENDVVSWYQDCPPVAMQQILEHFGGIYARRTDADVFTTATAFFNLAAERDNTEDALRKWTMVRISEIIQLLNGDPPKRSFDKDSLQILLHEYFSPFLDEE
ncbi:MAG TPA: hypothetical protein VMG09_16805 [Bacteroidota bacterium]|nr:hypothetical protein [Bacteroidota bacterium]